MSRVDEVLAEARGRLGASPTGFLDAELLLAHVLERARTWLHAWPEARIAASAVEHYTNLVERRAAGEPVAYLLGEREFHSLAFEVTPDVLIPRPETEQLVALALDHLHARGPSEPRVLELGTGSGCVAVTIAHARPDARVTAIETSAAALAIAQRNAARHGVVNVEFRTGAWFGPVERQHFDAIVSNPPYVASDDPRLGSGDVRFEPVAALDGGRNGLDALREIAAGAPHHLAAGGLVAVEHGANQGQAVAALFMAEGLTGVATHADDAGWPRVTSARARG